MAALFGPALPAEHSVKINMNGSRYMSCRVLTRPSIRICQIETTVADNYFLSWILKAICQIPCVY